MARHGRQQLLDRPMPLRSKRGQALVELLPATILFFTIIVAAFSYFKVMRSAVIRQEVVRNMAFAAIGNMGSMTTPPNHLADASGGGAAMKGLVGERFISKNKHTFIGANSTCIKLYPRDRYRSIPTQLPSFFQETVPEVGFVTFAVVQRRPAGTCN